MYSSLSTGLHDLTSPDLTIASEWYVWNHQKTTNNDDINEMSLPSQKHKVKGPGAPRLLVINAKSIIKYHKAGQASWEGAIVMARACILGQICSSSCSSCPCLAPALLLHPIVGLAPPPAPPAFHLRQFRVQ